MQCTYCGALDSGVRTRAGEMVCSHCGESLSSPPLPEEKTAAPVVTEPLDPAMPVRNPEAYALLCVLVELGLALVSWAMILLLGLDTNYLALPGVLCIESLVVLLFTAPAYWQCRQAIKGMRADEDWMRLAGEEWMRPRHWTYSEQEWQAFTSRAWRGAIGAALVVAGVFGAVLLIFGCVIIANAHDPTFAAITIGGLVAMFAFFSLPFLLGDLLPAWYQRRNEKRDAYVSLVGIILGGWCISPLHNVDQIAYQAGHPAVLRFRTHLGGRRGRAMSITELPVPREREAEAEQLARAFVSGV